jgi:hypothetical protein
MVFYMGLIMEKLYIVCKTENCGKRDSVKTINLAIIVTFFIVIFASASIVSADSITISATAQAFPKYRTVSIPHWYPRGLARFRSILHAELCR